MPQPNKVISLRTIFRRSQWLSLIITVVICMVTFASMSMFTMETYVKQNLQLLSNTLNDRVQPAVVFDDNTTLNQIVNEYIQQHSIRAIYIYDKNNQLILKAEKAPKHFSVIQKHFDDWFLHDGVRLDINHQQQKVGELQVFASSSKMLEFIVTFVVGFAIAMIVVIVALLWSSNLTYRKIVNELQPLSQVAQLVSEQKAYNLRFPPNAIREFQAINSVFNELLEEIQIWHTHLQTENHQLSFEVRHDYLTKLPNRNYFYQVLLNLFEDQSSRNNFALLFIDNNHFKDINDRYGHLAGDAVLQEMANRLRTRLRNQDFIARLGGDEFAVVLKSITQVEHLISIAENLIESSSQPLNFQGQMIEFSFSLGIAFSQYANTPEDLITQADQAMYKAKMLSHHWFIYKPE